MLKNEKGFTLIELIISITILSVVVVIVSQAFWLGQRSWEKGERVMTNDLTLRTVISMLSKQLRSTFPLVTKKRGKKNVYHFSGDPESIRFVTSLPVGLQKQGGLFHMNYFLEDSISTGFKVLKAVQRPIYEEAIFGSSRVSEGLTVLNDLIDVEWAYLEKGEWHQRWEGDEEEAFPEQVRLTLTLQDGEGEIVHEMSVPISAQLEDKGN